MGLNVVWAEVTRSKSAQLTVLGTGLFNSPGLRPHASSSCFVSFALSRLGPRPLHYLVDVKKFDFDSL